MLHKTKGLVLGHINFKESSIICRVYTQEFGIRSYIVNGAKSSRKGSKMAYFQPLSILEMVVYENEKKDIQRISEFRLAETYRSIPFDHNKTITAIFLSELLNKSLKEESGNSSKFEFLIEEILEFDRMENFDPNFHLYFMYKLSAYLGFRPGSIEDFVSCGIRIPASAHPLIIDMLEKGELPQNGQNRTVLLNVMLSYFQFHLDDFGAFKSLKVLQDIVHN